MKGKVQLDNLGTDGRILLKWIALMFQVDLSGSG